VIGVVAIHARLSSHCIGKAAKTDGERAILQRDVIGYAKAAPLPCGAQSIFILGIDFQWQAELRSSIATWSRGFARSVAWCTCFDVHPTFRASQVGVMHSSGWCFALLLWKLWTKTNPRSHGKHWGKTRIRYQLKDHDP